MTVDDDRLIIRGADEAHAGGGGRDQLHQLQDVSGDPDAPGDLIMNAISGYVIDQIKAAHVSEHQRLFRRVSVRFGSTPNASLPTDERLKNFDGTNDPDLAALIFQFGRYLPTPSSRPGTQPANFRASGASG